MHTLGLVHEQDVDHGEQVEDALVPHPRGIPAHVEGHRHVSHGVDLLQHGQILVVVGQSLVARHVDVLGVRQLGQIHVLQGQTLVGAAVGEEAAILLGGEADGDARLFGVAVQKEGIVHTQLTEQASDVLTVHILADASLEYGGQSQLGQTQSKESGAASHEGLHGRHVHLGAKGRQALHPGHHQINVDVAVHKYVPFLLHVLRSPLSLVSVFHIVIYIVI